jgi:hypothetical protein
MAHVKFCWFWFFLLRGLQTFWGSKSGVDLMDDKSLKGFGLFYFAAHGSLEVPNQV